MYENITEDLLKIINTKIFCLGDLMLDKYVIGSSQRISPEGPIPILDIDQQITMLGGVGNVVRNLQAIGAKIYLVSLIGKDQAGLKIQRELQKKSIIKKLFKDPERPSTVKTRFIANDQQVLRVDYEKNKLIDSKLENQIFAASKKMILDSDAVVLSDYNKGIFTKSILKKIIDFSKKHDKPIVLDPKGENFQKYKGVTLITPNINELEVAVGKKFKDEKDLIFQSRLLIKKYKFKNILVTRGKLGMILISSKKSNVLKLHTKAKEIFDVSGAGDTVVSFISACLASKVSMENSVKIANAAAGIVVSKPGTSVAHLSEIILSINEEKNVSSKLTNLSEGIKIINYWRDKNEKIGFTNGCFDYLHPGHISLFKEAKKKCSKLIVAINSDTSIRKLKGSDRPKQNEFLRAKILNSIKYIDLVIIFSENNPMSILKKIKPDLLVKGEDYKENQIVGSNFVKSYGGKVVRAKIFKNFSTSSIIEEISSSSY